MRTVTDVIDNCTLEVLVNDPHKPAVFADMLKAAKQAGFAPLRGEEVVNNGNASLEIVYKV